MWKESYRLGVERIDKQHQKLFKMTGALVQAARDGAGEETYKKALYFLKEYVVYHFQDEEDYQRAIGYSRLEEHIQQHREFAGKVQEYEEKLIENGYDQRMTKYLAGTLTAWLIHHVADSDQKLVACPRKKAMHHQSQHCTGLFAERTADVLEKMACFARSQISLHETNHFGELGDFFVEIELCGELRGKAVFGFSKELSFSLIRRMMLFDLEEPDELMQSALCELSNIACGSTAVKLDRRGIIIQIKTPVFSCGYEGPDNVGVQIDTGTGRLEIAVFLDEQTLERRYRSGYLRFSDLKEKDKK